MIWCVAGLVRFLGSSKRAKGTKTLPTKALGIIIPTYNRPDALLKCMAHLECQTFKDFEVVVVDDGSTDSTPKQMEAYLLRTPIEIRYVAQKNSGPAKARNLGISMLQTPVCLILGDDIFASPTLVERHMKLHEEHPDIEVAGLGLTQWSTTGQEITPFMRWLGKSPMQFAYEDLRAGVPADWRHFYTSNLSVKTELLKKFPFNEDFPYAAMEDCELGYRIQTQIGLNLNFLPDAAADHLHPTTFLQACQRMVRVGYSTRLFHELWPEARPRSSNWLKIAIKRTFVGRPRLLKALVRGADLCTHVYCPNPLMRCALACQYEVGYQSQRNSEGKLVRP
jgi:glycosyltransferase involved in cell wall biosynthesis